MGTYNLSETAKSSDKAALKYKGHTIKVADLVCVPMIPANVIHSIGNLLFNKINRNDKHSLK